MGREARMKSANTRIREEGKYELTAGVLVNAHQVLELTTQLLNGLERATQPPDWQDRLARFDSVAAAFRTRLTEAAALLEIWRQSEDLPNLPACESGIDDAEP